MEHRPFKVPKDLNRTQKLSSTIILLKVSRKPHRDSFVVQALRRPPDYRGTNQSVVPSSVVPAAVWNTRSNTDTAKSNIPPTKSQKQGTV